MKLKSISMKDWILETISERFIPLYSSSWDLDSIIMQEILIVAKKNRKHSLNCEIKTHYKIKGF